MKEIFEALEMEITEVDVEDVIRTSPTEAGGETEKDTPVNRDTEELDPAL